jgi:hypothetical protein
MWSNDINQGREGAKDVPESDQWDDHMKMPNIPKGWRAHNYHKKQVMTGYNGRGVAREIQDELFMSRQCKNVDPNHPTCPNPHDGHKEGTRWSFHFPANFHGQTAVNKAIALRRINCSPRNYDFDLGFWITRNADHANLQTLTYFTITSKMDIYEAIGLIVYKTNERIADFMKQHADPNWPRMAGGYNSDTGSVFFHFQPTGAAGAAQFTIVLHGATDDGFFNLMNCAPGVVHWSDPVMLPQIIKLTYPNVWNRQDLYFHGSFVNHTAFNYLGKAGDFYMEPNKLFKADNSTQEFFLEVSLDGMTPVDLPYEDFEVELSLIVDTMDVMSF